MTRKQAQSSKETGAWVEKRGYVPLASGKESSPPKGGSGVSSVTIVRDANGSYVASKRDSSQKQTVIKGGSAKARANKKAG